MRIETEAVFLFIAELTGSFVPGSGTKELKIRNGQQDYTKHVLHMPDLSTEEGRKDLHETMWLERLYKELDEYFRIPDCSSDPLTRWLAIDNDSSYREETYKWTVPLELDATSSMCQIIGILLNDERLMNMTNVIGETLEDAWKVEGVGRNMLKKVMTPKLYGSSQSPEALLKKAKIPFTAKDIAIINKELQTGAFGLANSFKDFIINNCNPKAAMEIEIGKDAFAISCNKFRNVGEKTKAYKIWDSIDETYNTILHTDTKKVPDLEQFRLYFVTLLIHNLDSQIMDNVTAKVMEKYDWCISIHDAVTCSPAAAADVRLWYGQELEYIHNNRAEILRGFFKSVGITSEATEAWEKVKAKVQPLKGKFVISMPLK